MPSGKDRGWVLCGQSEKMFGKGAQIMQRDRYKAWLSSLIFLIGWMANASGNDIGAGAGASLAAQWDTESAIVRVFYSSNERGCGRLSFVNEKNNKPVSVFFMSDDDKGDICDLRVKSLTSFNGVFFVTQESATGFLVKAFIFDEKNNTATQVLSDGSRMEPELFYSGNEILPSIGLLKFIMNSSKGDSPIFCGRVIYAFDSKSDKTPLIRSVVGNCDGAR